MSQGIAKSERKVESPDDARTENSMIVEAKNLLEHLVTVSERIANRAYEFFETKGRRVGGDVDDWLQAEMELLRPAPVEITEAGGELKIRAAVPGFTARDIKVSVEPRRVILSGRTEQSQDSTAEELVYTEHRSKEILRAVDLPVEVDPATVSANLQDGMLLLSMARAKPKQPVEIPVE
jgi:HSP20 family protein